MPEKNLKAFQPRRHHRYKQKITIRLCVKSVCGTIDTIDVSDGGLGLDLATARDLPELKIGSIVSTRAADDDQSLPKVGKVVRIDKTEIGIEYVC